MEAVRNFDLNSTIGVRINRIRGGPVAVLFTRSTRDCKSFTELFS